MNAALPDAQSALESEEQLSPLQHGNLTLEPATYRVYVDEEIIDVTLYEFEMLRLFMERPDRILPYEFLTTELFGKSDHGATRHLNVLVHRLRSKLVNSSPYGIETVRGRGYGLLRARRGEQPQGRQE